jgi:DNA-binding HxlR family transcriptional regulator
MIKNGLIRKKIYQKTPRVTKYFITKKGKGLLQVYMSIINFAMEHYTKEILIDEKPKKIEDLFSKEIMKLVK